MYDVIVVGGGPAGLSAALLLGRCRRSVLVLDAGEPRGSTSRQLYGFLTREGITPQELLRLGREELARYQVEYRRAEATDARRNGGTFIITLSDTSQLQCRTLLLATGVSDRLPEIDGLVAFQGRGVYISPYTNGWELSGAPMAVYGRGKTAANLAVTLKTWTGEVTLCTDGGPYLRPPDADLLAQYHIPVRSERIERVEGDSEKLARIVFRNGASLPCHALFLATGQTQRSSLAERLGAELNERGGVRANLVQETGVDGLFVAGDACHDLHLAVAAAAEGAKAAVAINQRLQAE